MNIKQLFSNAKEAVSNKSIEIAVVGGALLTSTTAQAEAVGGGLPSAVIGIGAKIMTMIEALAAEIWPVILGVIVLLITIRVVKKIVPKAV